MSGVKHFDQGQDDGCDGSFDTYTHGVPLKVWLMKLTEGISAPIFHHDTGIVDVPLRGSAPSPAPPMFLGARLECRIHDGLGAMVWGPIMRDDPAEIVPDVDKGENAE